MRADKLLEENQFGSRKTTKRLFQRRLVEVDGEIVSDPSRNVDPTLQEITVSGKKVSGKGHVYYLMNKPAGAVSAVRDSKNQTVLDLLRPEDKKPGIYPVGRLDGDTEGLLLLTDNGHLGYQLLLPEKQVPKTYEAVVNAEVTTADKAAFAKGIEFIGGFVCQPAELEILSSSPQESRVRLIIREGKFHQVKKMFLATGKKVTYLKRISMGPLCLEETLAPGEYRTLSKKELEKLRPYF